MNDQQDLSRFDHIPTSEIEKDIHDTEAEINDMETIVAVLMHDPQENKTHIYLTEGGLSKRRAFVDELNKILEFRRERDGRHE